MQVGETPDGRPPLLPPAAGPGSARDRAASAEAPKAKLEARHVSFRYGTAAALRDVSVPLYEHRITAFMGPSGCGKSTLLRIFNRMYDLYADQHVEGEVLLDGRNILGNDVDVKALRARVGMVFQQPTPFATSIYNNVAYGIRLSARLKRREMDERVEYALRRAALWDEVKDMLAQNGQSLSGGQQQRLCIARTIAVRPEVILFDEPTSALDPISTAKIEETMEELKADYTLAVVTHNLEQAARISDHAAFMYLGELVEFGETQQVFTTPVNRQTQDYVTGRFG